MSDLIGTVGERGTTEIAAFKRVMSRYPSGVVVVAASVHGQPYGMAVNSFTSVSLHPMLVLFCVDRASTTWPYLHRAGRFAVSVLAGHHEEVCRTFARRGADRFTGVDWALNGAGQPILLDAVAWLDCVVTAIHPGGDHLIVVGEVHRAYDRPDAVPLVFHSGRLRPLPAAAGQAE